MKRGEIYFLSIPTGTTTGYEIMYNRPAIVVSCDNLASSGNTVTVIPCSSSQRSKLRCHVDISSTGRDCRALVEQITTVDKERLGRYLGNVTSDELRRIDAALLNYLGLSCAENAGERDLREEDAEIVDARTVQPVAPVAAEREQAYVGRLSAELDVYKRLYNDLLSMMMRTA